MKHGKVVPRKVVVTAFGHTGRASMFYNRRLCYGWFPGKYPDGSFPVRRHVVVV